MDPVEENEDVQITLPDDERQVDAESLAIELDPSGQATLAVPGREVDFEFENRLLPDGLVNGTSVTILNERNKKSGDKATKKRRSFFRRKRSKSQQLTAEQDESPTEIISSMDSTDYVYENHVALPGVENGYPAIIVSEVIDSFDEVVPTVMTSLDVCDDDVALTTDTPNGSFRVKKRKRPKPRKFSIASALTDVSFRSEQTSSSKISSKSRSTLLEVDLEADEDLKASLNELIQNRKGGLEPGHRRRRKRSGHSTLSSDSEASDRETDVLDMYSGKQNDEEVIFDNIKLQKEIMETLRTQAWPMRKKLKTLQLAKSYVEKYEGQLSRGHGYQEASAKYWKRVKREFMNFLSLLIPWEMRIKLIESYFGSVVASYFTFLRWLFWVNIVMTVLSLCFIVVPEILFGSPWGSIPQKSIPENELSRALNFDTIMDWRGYLEYSFLFYGYYANTVKLRGIYRLPLAYLLVGLSFYAVSFLIILRKMTANARLNKLTSKDEQYTFTWKTFTSWDFMIGNTETAKNKVAEISTVLRETIEEEKERTKKKITKTLIFLRILANMLVVIVLASSIYAIYLVVDRSQEVELRVQRGENVGWWDQNEVSFVMSLITALYPNLFDLIGLMEKYAPRVNLRLQLARILVLYLMNLYTLMFALYWKIVDRATAVKAVLADNNCTMNTLTTLSPNVATMSGSVDTTMGPNCTHDSSTRICWETMLGQEISKLVFFDLIMTVATIIFIDFIRGLGVRYLSRYWCWDLERQFPEYGEFKIAENLLHAIYNQATVWLGCFFAPLLAAVNIVKLVIMLYVRSWAVLVCNIPHERVFRASRSNNFYFATLLLMLFLVTLPVAFLLVQLEPSLDCGPFKGFQRSYHVLTKTIEDEFPAVVNMVLDYIASPGVIIPLILLLMMAIYYLLSLNASLRESNKDLRNQLHVERTEEREKAYKMGEARQEDTNGAGVSGLDKPAIDNAVPVQNHVENEKQKDKDGGEEEKQHSDTGAPQVVERGTRILRIPGMSLDHAHLLRSKYPGVRVMSREEAIRLCIIPPPPPPPPEPETDEEPEVRIEQPQVPEGDESPDEDPPAYVRSQPPPENPTPPPDLQSSDLMSPVPQALPVRTRSGSGSSPPIAVVHGKPSTQRNLFRFGGRQDALDEAVLF